MPSNEYDDLDELLRALAHPARRRVIELARHEPVPAGMLARELDLASATLSEHLRVLRKCGLVTMEISGTWRLYQTAPDRLDRLVELIDDFRKSIKEKR